MECASMPLQPDYEIGIATVNQNFFSLAHPHPEVTASLETTATAPACPLCGGKWETSRLQPSSAYGYQKHITCTTCGFKAVRQGDYHGFAFDKQDITKSIASEAIKAAVLLILGTGLVQS